LIEDELTVPLQLQLNALAELQVFLPGDEEFDELAGEDLLDAAPNSARVLSWRTTTLQHATLADDCRLQA